MDVNFEKNQLKPGQAGYVYDKVVEFKQNDAESLADDSWGEDDGIGEQDYGEDDEDAEDDALEKQVNQLI